MNQLVQSLNCKGVPMEYDNTNRGVAFPPLDKQRMLLTGSCDYDGDGKKQLVLVTDTDKQDRNVLVVYQRVGVLYADDDATPDNKKPNYSGPMDNNYRMAGWKREKDGKKYLSLKREPRQYNGSQNTQETSQISEVIKDDIPF